MRPILISDDEPLTSNSAENFEYSTSPSVETDIESPGSENNGEELAEDGSSVSRRDGSSPTFPDFDNNISELSMRQRKTRPLKSIHTTDLIYPKSRYKGFDPPLPIYFTIYLPANKLHPFELRPLQNLASKNAHSCFLFDGVLSAGSKRRYVEAVPFKVCSIGNYGEDFHEVGDNIWIQSDFNGGSDLFYRLKTPASEYSRFHNSFLWLADLAKHFVDYCQACQNQQKAVSVHHFGADFSIWAKKIHGGSPIFQQWYQKYQHDDFRRAVAANINFLFKEAIGVNEELCSLAIWSELLDRNAIPQHEIKEVKTVVTPYVYECFQHLRFGHHLKSVAPTEFAQTRRIRQGEALHLTLNDNLIRPHVKVPNAPTAHSSTSVRHDAVSSLDERRRKINSIQTGDVLAVTKDGEGSFWKDEISRWKAADNCWYIYVQGVHQTASDKRSFDGIWLYKPSDTCCAKMKYPFQNELFLSDNCTCLRSRITEHEILDVVNVAWHSHPLHAQQEFFIRQTYLENERFVTLKEEHKKCEHFKDHEKSSPQRAHKYQIGQTVLVPPQRKSKHTLEPYEIVAYIQEGARELAVLRRLLRRSEIEGQNSRPNELVYTEEKEKVLARKINRACLVRFYSEADVASRSIPTPYNRDGTGNAFYITTKLLNTDGPPILTPIDNDIPRSLIQGFDPLATPSRKKLQGLDLYCGGGNFGRGLEEGGAMQNRWAVDLARNAIHTYFANLKDPDATKLFFGSVDDLLTQVLSGIPNQSNLSPLPGDVDFISAGSPCQGFSVLNPGKNNEKGLKNQSLVASVAAYVDIYRPKYGLLENVMSMAQKGRGRDEDVLSQLICAIVGMGYQVQLFVLDAWSCGSPQSRSRLFVSFTAPGYEPLEHPELSHSHPPKVLDRGLGKLANGESFGKRIHGPTPFEFVTAGKATSDLPAIGDGRTYHCIQHPDHVMAQGISKELKLQIEVIPIHPRGMNFSSTWNGGNGSMTREDRALFPKTTRSGRVRQGILKGSRAWGRVHPNGLFPTIVVCVSASDSRMGTILHWDEQRYLTVMEARRAQSLPDEEVLAGAPAEQWKLLGNSVPRSVSLALGLSLREAWLKNSPVDEEVINSFANAPADEVTSWSGIASGSKPEQKLKSLKRRYTGIQEIRIDPTENLIKAPRLSSRSSYASSQVATSSPHTAPGENMVQGQTANNQSVNPLTLSTKLQVIVQSRHFIQNGDSDESSISNASFGSLALQRRAKTRTIITPTRDRSKKPSRSAPKAQFFINLISDDEDSAEGAISSPANIPPKKYIPADNSKFKPYAETNRLQGIFGKSVRKL